MATSLPSDKLSLESKTRSPAPLSFSTSSSGDADESSDSSASDITFCIKQCTSRWMIWAVSRIVEGSKLYDRLYRGNHSRNALDKLPIRFFDEIKPFNMQMEEESTEDEQDDIAKESRIGLWKHTFSSKHSEREEKLLQCISSAITIDINEQRYWKDSLRTSGNKRRGKLLHGAYPDHVKNPKVAQKTQRQIQQSIENLLSLECSEELPAWYIRHMVTKAELFVDAVALYLNQQPELREYGVIDLFATFAAVAGINFRNAQSVDRRQMKVFGVDVTSETALRAYASGLSLPEKNRRVPPRGKVDVISIAEVKVTPPDESKHWLDSLQPLSGQLLGEMLLEMPYSAIEHTHHALAAFAVQSTHVTVCILVIPKETLEYIQLDEHDALRYRSSSKNIVEKAVLDWSVTLDIMKPADRLKLWTFMMKLVNTENKKTQ